MIHSYSLKSARGTWNNLVTEPVSVHRCYLSEPVVCGDSITSLNLYSSLVKVQSAPLYR